MAILSFSLWILFRPEFSAAIGIPWKPYRGVLERRPVSTTSAAFSGAGAANRPQIDSFVFGDRSMSTVASLVS